MVKARTARFLTDATQVIAILLAAAVIAYVTAKVATGQEIIP